MLCLNEGLDAGGVIVFLDSGLHGNDRDLECSVQCNQSSCLLFWFHSFIINHDLCL